MAMLVGFGVLGLVAAWRAHGLGTSTWILWGVGAALALGALLPGAGRFVYLAVYVVSGLIGYVISRVLLTLIFFLLFMPIGLALRAAGKDPLHLRPPAEWLRREGARGASSYYRQY